MAAVVALAIPAIEHGLFLGSATEVFPQGSAEHRLADRSAGDDGVGPVGPATKMTKARWADFTRRSPDHRCGWLEVFGSGVVASPRAGKGVNRKRTGVETADCISTVSEAALVSPLLVMGSGVARVVVITPVAWMASSWASIRARGRGGVGGGSGGVDEGAVQCADGPAVGTPIGEGSGHDDVEEPARGFADQRGWVGDGCGCPRSGRRGSSPRPACAATHWSGSQCVLLAVAAPVMVVMLVVLVVPGRSFSAEDRSGVAVVCRAAPVAWAGPAGEAPAGAGQDTRGRCSCRRGDTERGTSRGHRPWSAGSTGVTVVPETRQRVSITLTGVVGWAGNVPGPRPPPAPGVSSGGCGRRSGTFGAGISRARPRNGPRCGAGRGGMTALNTIAPGPDGEYVFGKTLEPADIAEVGRAWMRMLTCNWGFFSNPTWCDHRPPPTGTRKIVASASSRISFV